MPASSIENDTYPRLDKGAIMRGLEPERKREDALRIRLLVGTVIGIVSGTARAVVDWLLWQR